MEKLWTKDELIAAKTYCAIMFPNMLHTDPESLIHAIRQTYPGGIKAFRLDVTGPSKELTQYPPFENGEQY